MLAEKQKQAAFELVYLVSCAINGCIPDKERIEKMDLSLILDLAKAHSLSCIAAYALRSAGIRDSRFDECFGKSKRKEALFDVERVRICEALNRLQVWHMPLKGCILKNLYPAYGMREMSDHDFLCDRTKMADVKNAMESLGFECQEYGHPVRDIYYKKPSLSFEMHRCLYYEGVEFQRVFLEYYRDIEKLMIRDSQDSFGYHLSDEDFYIFMLSHEYRHYHYAGTGLRSLLDIYVFLKKKSDSLDFDYIGEQLEKLSMTEFERMNRELAFSLFDKKPLSAEQRSQLLYFLSSGTYGTKRIMTNNRLSRQMGEGGGKKAKITYLKDRVFLHGEKLKKHYPFIYEHKALLPAFYVGRIGQTVLKHPKENLKEFFAVRDFSAAKDDSVLNPNDKHRGTKDE